MGHSVCRSDGKEHILTADNHESMMIWLMGLQVKNQRSKIISPLWVPRYFRSLQKSKIKWNLLVFFSWQAKRDAAAKSRFEEGTRAKVNVLGFYVCEISCNSFVLRRELCKKNTKKLFVFMQWKEYACVWTRIELISKLDSLTQNFFVSQLRFDEVSLTRVVWTLGFLLCSSGTFFTSISKMLALEWVPNMFWVHSSGMRVNNKWSRIVGCLKHSNHGWNLSRRSNCGAKGIIWSEVFVSARGQSEKNLNELRFTDGNDAFYLQESLETTFEDQVIVLVGCVLANGHVKDTCVLSTNLVALYIGYFRSTRY